MSYCPICGCEYGQGIATCEECGVRLVDKPPEKGAHEKLRDAYTTKSPAIAEMVKDVLEQEGIGVILSNELGSAILPLGGESSDIKVMVSAEKIPEAHSLIKSFFEDSPDIAEFIFCSNCGARVEADQSSCPFCGEQFDETTKK